jgi:hypothetical protein
MNDCYRQDCGVGFVDSVMCVIGFLSLNVWIKQSGVGGHADHFKVGDRSLGASRDALTECLGTAGRSRAVLLVVFRHRIEMDCGWPLNDCVTIAKGVGSAVTYFTRQNRKVKVVYVSLRVQRSVKRASCITYHHNHPLFQSTMCSGSQACWCQL